MHLPIVLCCGTEGELCTNTLSNVAVKLLNLTSLQTFVHVPIQVIKLQEHACRILMYGPKSVFVVFQKRDAYTNFYCAYFLRLIKLNHFNKFRCWSSLVSEIHEFNRNKMNNSKNDLSKG